MPLVTSDGNIALLTIQDSVREDTAKYSLVATNAAGTATGHVRANIVCIPSPCRDLKTPEVTESSVSLEWVMPEDDGGAPVNSYILQMVHHVAMTILHARLGFALIFFKLSKNRVG